MPASGLCAQFQCEVLSVSGVAIATSPQAGDRSLKQGDLLGRGDEVTVGDESYVDLAYDKDRQNVTRLESNTHVKIASVVPGKLDLSNGSVFAKMKKLPRHSEFEVKTPTAVASVRGTEYLIRHARGHTEVLNASASPVFVYGVKTDGTKDTGNQVVLEKAQKTSIQKPGQVPVEPAVMTDEEQAVGETLTRAIEKNIETAVLENRPSTIQTVEEVEAFIQKTKEESETLAVAPPNESELSRVTDTRRRAFGGQKAFAPPEPDPEPEEPAKKST